MRIIAPNASYHYTLATFSIVVETPKKATAFAYDRSLIWRLTCSNVCTIEVTLPWLTSQAGTDLVVCKIPAKPLWKREPVNKDQNQCVCVFGYDFL
jgi:hypothetical protein